VTEVDEPSELVPCCVWRISNDLVLAVDRAFGEPDDAYVNGAQVWIRDDGPGGATLEWRLHPVARFRQPAGVGTHELLETVVYALRANEPPPRPVSELWDGLEAFPGFGDDAEPAVLAAACTNALGLAPHAFGIVDHGRIADAWEAAAGDHSVIAALLAQLAT
jgi:hypothetical protein